MELGIPKRGLVTGQQLRSWWAPHTAALPGWGRNRAVQPGCTRRARCPHGHRLSQLQGLSFPSAAGGAEGTAQSQPHAHPAPG